MSDHLKHYLSHYFAPHPTREMKEMYWVTALHSFAVAAVGIFEPIYLYKIGFSISAILLFFIADYIGYFLLIPLGARISKRLGCEYTIMLSSPFLILYYLSLFAIPRHAAFIGTAIVVLTIHKVLYWPSYHANFIACMNGHETGKEVSNRFAIMAIAAALAPFFGGLFTVYFGFGALFVGTSGLILLSNAFLLRTPEVFMPASFSYIGAFKRFFRGVGSRVFFAYFGFGEQLISVALWPIYIVLMIPSLLSIGIVVSLAHLVDVLITLYAGRLSDEDIKPKILHSGTVFTTASWLLRPFVAGPLGVFLIDSYYRVSRNMIAVPFFSLTYQEAHKQDDAMSAVVFAEMSLAVGKIVIACLALAAIALFPETPWTALFVLAALSTMFYSLLPSKKRVKTNLAVSE